MPFANAGKHVMLDALGAVGVWVSLHDDDPGTTGANELSGGSPAYARKQIAWAAASGGSMSDSTNGLEFDVPAGDVAHAGVWSASSGGTFYGSDPVTTETFAAQGTYTLTDFTLTIAD